MDFYFGIDLLQQLRQYYEGRLSLALAKGFDQQDAKYHWLFKELECRVSTLRKLMSMISVLPEFMCRQTEEQIFAMVIGHTTTWFSNENLGGEQPRDAKGNCLYYQDTNPYWVDMREAMDRFTLSYDYTHLSTFYADLVEYIVMTVRLYFFIREKQFRPIDRGKYDELVAYPCVRRCLICPILPLSSRHLLKSITVSSWILWRSTVSMTTTMGS